MTTLAFIIACAALGSSLAAVMIAWDANIAARKAARGERPPWRNG